MHSNRSNDVKRDFNLLEETLQSKLYMRRKHYRRLHAAINSLDKSIQEEKQKSLEVCLL